MHDEILLDLKLLKNKFKNQIKLNQININDIDATIHRIELKNNNIYNNLKLISGFILTFYFLYTICN